LISESDTSHLTRWTSDSHELMFDEGFKIGFQKALELMGDKKYNREFLLDIIPKVIQKRLELTSNEFNDWYNSEFLKIIFDRKEWDVEVVMEKFDLSFGCYKIQTKFDEEGCLILKRI